MAGMLSMSSPPVSSSLSSSGQPELLLMCCGLATSHNTSHLSHSIPQVHCLWGAGSAGKSWSHRWQRLIREPLCSWRHSLPPHSDGGQCPHLCRSLCSLPALCERREDHAPQTSLSLELPLQTLCQQIRQENQLQRLSVVFKIMVSSGILLVCHFLLRHGCSNRTAQGVRFKGRRRIKIAPRNGSCVNFAVGDSERWRTERAEFL